MIYFAKFIDDAHQALIGALPELAIYSDLVDMFAALHSCVQRRRMYPAPGVPQFDIVEFFAGRGNICRYGPQRFAKAAVSRLLEAKALAFSLPLFARRGREVWGWRAV